MRVPLVVSLVLAVLLTANAYAAGSSDWTTYLYGNSRDNAVQDGGSYAGGILHLKTAWTFNVKGPIVSSPVIEGNIAYVPSWDGNLYALDLTTHQLLWKRALGTQKTWIGPGGVSSPPEFVPDIGRTAPSWSAAAGRSRKHRNTCTSMRSMLRPERSCGAPLSAMPSKTRSSTRHCTWMAACISEPRGVESVPPNTIHRVRAPSTNWMDRREPCSIPSRWLCP